MCTNSFEKSTKRDSLTKKMLALNYGMYFIFIFDIKYRFV